MPDRILITGARSAAALDLARDFRAIGCEVHLADCAASRIAGWSRSVTRMHRYPSPVRNADGFRRRIAELVERLDPVLVVPVCEEAFHLAAPQLQAALARRLFQPALETLRLLHDKLAFAGLAAELGLPIPETRAIADEQALLDYAGESADWVFKPCFSRFGEEALVGPAPERLARLAIAPARAWLAQRRVRGAEASFYAVARDGRLRGFAAYRSDWRLPGGASFAFVPLRANETAKLKALAETLAGRLNLTGQFACDAIFDESGQPWLIECNPRATSGVHLLVGDGQLARAILDPDAPVAVGVDRPVHLLPAMLTFGLGTAVTNRRVGEWVRTIRTGSDAIGRSGDRLPALGALLDGCRFALAGWQQGTSTSAASTADIQWNGEDFA